MGTKTILISAVIFVLIIINLAASRPEKRQALEPFTFEDIYDPQYRTKRPDTRWISGEDAYTYRDPITGELWKESIANTAVTRTLLIDNSTFTSLRTGTYYVSPDVQFVLFAYEITSLWRHSFTAKYKILDIASNSEIDFPSGALADSVLQYAGWSTSGHSLSFVMDNNLYYQLDPNAAPTRITTNGNPLYLFNGVPDWLYEEEILGDRVAHYWSPTGSHICYAQFNDTGVPLQAWPYYGSKDDVYGSTRQVAYPKAGRVLPNGDQGENSRVTLFVTDINSTTTVELQAPVGELTNDHYYTQVAWLDADRVYVTWTNRVQNHSISIIYNITDWSSVENLNFNVTGGWLEVPSPTPWFIDNGQSYLTVHANNGWRHLAMITSASGATGAGAITFLTSGNHEVQSVVGHKSTEHLVLIITTNGDPTERHLIEVNIADPANPVQKCLTCGDSELPDYLAAYRYFSASFSDSGLYYFLNALGPDVPVYLLVSRTMGDVHEMAVKTFEDNHQLKAALSLKAMPTREFIDVPIEGTPYTTKAEVFYPADPDHDVNSVYPLLIYVYAGPGSQRVTKAYPHTGGSTTNWLTYLKSSHKVIVASIDNRGSMAQGEQFKFEMYRKLGTVEVQDQIYFGEYAKTRIAHVDNSKNIAMFGWSYGGGTTAHAIGDPSQTIKCGISVAPVTTMRYYDTAYTERYLGLSTPSDDELGYNNTDVMTKVQNFHGKQFFIAHGIADDNVHLMHTTQLIRALANEGIQFRQNVYPDQNHGISATQLNRHLFNTSTNFLLNDCSWSTVKQPDCPSGSHAVPGPNGNIAFLFLSMVLVALSKMNL